ncbi:hypothetical protein WEU38_01935 [Cyanobacterium aponinum AL20118]|uniref:Uncharacterized protein n=2 Tax=Cyanobacterium aponinum TaxID=379064 RepID=K9Z7C5_CYAAP|nr:hypothetical protein [Cyanobacterium aponinum]AFZ54273.1 hypothetical protein Cyan10605_2187 [Cyanobacterium aponinum PCC 10605]MBD2393881.1 hypothetical protein [Cyanobacterium aponinum FACHB-4101]PHV64305.1 hypothetical protein CSQ80_00325 [Cyanobacterium aponinum IPPAS B-1201]WPF89063.1 hypothetical protein SAY89_01950 [Cyanobacterium aponinum AL20115]
MKEDNLRSRKRKPRNLSEKLDAQVEKIVYKVMTNEGLEETVNTAIQKALISLIIRYSALIIIGLLLVLALQNLILVIILKSFWE